MSMPCEHTSRLTLASGGGLETAMLPYYVSRFLMTTPIKLGIALSPSAETFVSTLTLEALSQNPVYTEERKLNPYTGEPFHLIYSSADLLLIYPATPRILASIALGIIQCPVTRLAAHFNKKNIVIVPWLHPDHDEHIYWPHIETLVNRGCSVVLPTEGGLHWKTESGWFKGVTTALNHMNISNPMPNQMLWAAHRE